MLGTTAASHEGSPLMTAVVEASSTPLWVIGRTGAVAHLNQAAATLLGVPRRSELDGAPSHEALHAHHGDGSPFPAAQYPIVRAADRAVPSASGHERFLHRDGHSIPVAWTLHRMDAVGHLLLEFRPSSSPPAGIPAAEGERARARRVIRERADDPAFDPRALARCLHRSLRSVQSLLAAEGDSPAALIRHARLDRARELMLMGCGVAEASRRAGFRDPDTFARAFRGAHGITPARWACDRAPEP